MTKAIRRCVREAQRIYEIDLSNLRIEYALEHDYLAEAAIDGYRTRPVIRVNPKYLAQNPDIMVEEVAPHEVAHLVAFMLEDRRRPWNHGKRWREVCRALGGNGTQHVDPTPD